MTGRVLIIAHLQRHAMPRTLTLISQLPEYGWTPVVLTPALDEKNGLWKVARHSLDSQENIKVVETANPDRIGLKGAEEGSKVMQKLGIRETSPLYRFLQQVYAEWYGIKSFPDSEKAWIQPAIKAGEEFLDKIEVDVILSTSAPYSTHLIAHYLARSHNIPWIADLRDPWSRNQDSPYITVRKWRNILLERKTLKDADAIVTTSPYWRNDFAKVYGENKCFFIRNGFEPELLQEHREKMSKKFQMVYTGFFYNRHQNLDLLFTALRDLLAKHPDWNKELLVEFYGPSDDVIERRIVEYDLQNNVFQKSEVSREKAISLQRKAQVLLLFPWMWPAEPGWYPMKLFEYLAAQRPILSVGGYGGDAIEEMLRDTGAGIYTKDGESLTSAIETMHSEWNNEGTVRYRGNTEALSKYSTTTMVEDFVRVINLVARREAP